MTENSNDNQKKEKFYHKKWFAILLMVFIATAPIGILLMWLNGFFSKKVRIAVTIVLMAIFIPIAIQQDKEQEAEHEKLREQREIKEQEKAEAKEKEDKEQKEQEEAEKEKEEEEKDLSVKEMVAAVEDGEDVKEVIEENGKEVEEVKEVDLGEEGGNTLQISNDDTLALNEESFMKMARHMFDSVEVAFADEDIDTVQVFVQDEFTMENGENKTQNVFSYNYTREDFEDLELDNFKDLIYGEEYRVFQQAENYAIHPAIYDGLKDKYKNELTQ